MVKEYTFDRVIMSPEEFEGLLEINRQDVYYVAAMTVAALCNYKDGAEKCHAMINMLKNPAEPMSVYEKQFLRDRLSGKEYKPYSYLSGTAPQNGYIPAFPAKVQVADNPYSFITEDWATLLLQSSGADSQRQIKLRRKKSTGEWFLVEQFLLADIREPVINEQGAVIDPWA